ncbi:hypothetical protein KAFR_0J01270 [Kazachstania africana CBS 2517]|uniref:Transcriptional regulatory protein SDS3 n=1 Tax=Kazachstania africana (strain ATCC 22294 / BCRC 22015 / CBS 2517 / CECT 1963 / NBRC 1671 / NRRL Y-8276) TaxID=1071382 RepID=H2B0P4_KAZAF|nr:hypothetical protein KAFR_0J01270 [Kazachstania africana CBS 2517]CCF60194.1 hypothetical protein KAFR_0J01270 [Kazachstania africana CBS 2517]
MMNSKDISRKDKRRYNLENKIFKIQSSFKAERDLHYRNKLTKLQTNLTSLHQGNNPIFQGKLHDLEEERDLDLVRLRLFEEYRVIRSKIEFHEDIDKIKSNHENLVKLCKEKLYQLISSQIKKLKQEKILLDVANSNSYSMNYNNGMFQQKFTRSQTTTNGWESSSNSNTDTATSLNTAGRSLRRRGAGNVTESNEESDINRTASNLNATSDYNSDTNDFFQSLNEHTDLQNLLFGDAQNATQSTTTTTKKKTRGNQRYSTKSAPPLQSLSIDEVTDDIELIRHLTDQKPSPFKRT